MHHISLDSETDFDGWRRAARALASNHIPPAEITWSVQHHPPGLSEPSLPPPVASGEGPFSVPAHFITLAKVVILHRDRERFALLYRLLWRLRTDHDLLDATTDPDVAQATAMAAAVQRDAQRMQTQLRFREIGRERAAHYVAWFEPEHHSVALAAPFFARRFADMPWSILTPEACVHWDGHAMSFTPGISRTEMSGEDRLEESRLEEIWRRHFHPDQPPPAATARKRWRNPTEASILEPLLADAERWTGAPPFPRPEAVMKRKSETADLDTLREEAAHCRACPLWKDATQTVFGEGPDNATIMLVGEQPGDKEDIAGKPFVGPAGLMLDRAMEEAGIDRKKVYVTNAVKHFKFVPRGKIRLHQKPSTPEIKACRQWYERELAALRPVLVVALGATAAQCVFGKITPVNRNRGRLIALDEAVQVLVTVHPSYLLRVPDQAAKTHEYRRFVDDLKIAAKALRKSVRAA